MKEAGKILRNSSHLQAALVFLILLNLIFFPVIWRHKTLMLSAQSTIGVTPNGAYAKKEDIAINPFRQAIDYAPGWISEPWNALIHQEMVQEGVVPLWNPYSGMGMPLMANMQSQPLFPLSLLFLFRLSPFLNDLFLLTRLFLCGWLTFLFLRLSLSKLPSILGGVAFMLTGYFMMTLNMPEHSVALTIPLLLYSFEKLLRKGSALNLALASASVSLVLLGGMPELSFLVLIYGGMYFVFRYLIEARFLKPSRSIGSALSFVAANILGLFMATPLVLPFLEYMHQSFNVHDEALTGVKMGAGGMTDFMHSALLHLLPFDYSRFISSRGKFTAFTPYVYGYWGVSVSVLASFAIAGMMGLKGAGRRAMSMRQAGFFALSALILLLKYYGSPAVNWIGELPLFSMIIFTKYEEPLLGFSFAALAAIGMDRLIQRSISIKAICISTAALCGLYVWLLIPNLVKPHEHREMVCGCPGNQEVFLVLTGIIFAIALLMLAVKKYRKAFGAALIGVVATELFLLFPAWAYYWSGFLPSRALNPYAGAPFIAFLKKDCKEYERVFSECDYLTANWSSAFQIQDIRALDAMLPARYLPFVRNLILGSPEPSKDPDGDQNFSNRFTGREQVIPEIARSQNNYLLRRLWTLCSVRDWIRLNYSHPQTAVMEEIARQNQKKIGVSFHLRSFEGTDGAWTVLFEHPTMPPAPRTSASYTTVVDAHKPLFHLAVGLQPEIYDPSKGDGVTFHLDLTPLNGKSQNLFTSYIDPKSRPEDRGLKPANVDLSKYTGQPVTLIFWTDPGPKGDTVADWAGWADLEWRSHDHPNGVHGTEIYSGECAIYENKDRLPRAALFHSVSLAHGSDEALAILRARSFDPQKTVVIEDGTMPHEQPSMAADLSHQPPEPCESGQISEYKSQLVKIKVNSQRPGLLMLNDTYYPGWTAYLDGSEAKIVPADYLFRGVFIPSGPHLVIFKYEPLSFRLGLVLCFLALIVLVSAVLYERRLGERRKISR